MRLCHSSSVYVEGDIETRIYNDSINGEIKNIPEICVRRDGSCLLLPLLTLSLFFSLMSSVICFTMETY